MMVKVAAATTATTMLVIVEIINKIATMISCTTKTDYFVYRDIDVVWDVADSLAKAKVILGEGKKRYGSRNWHIKKVEITTIEVAEDVEC